ncbi:MAG: hypothetical protein IPG78_08130 [Ignavibacteria bacterium]|nr:hypothetical protein [Ignavibacteria bacterium]
MKIKTNVRRKQRYSKRRTEVLTSAKLSTSRRPACISFRTGRQFCG